MQRKSWKRLGTEGLADIMVCYAERYFADPYEQELFIDRVAFRAKSKIKNAKAPGPRQPSAFRK